MKKTISILIILTLCLAVFPMSASAGEKSAGWAATILAEGSDIGGVNQYSVGIGVENGSYTLPSPPAPPEYTVKMELVAPDESRLSKDVRTDGEGTYVWVIAIDPRGNKGNPHVAQTATLRWNPQQFGRGKYELREGYDGTGQLLVGDMRAVTSYEVVGTTENYVSLVFHPKTH